MTINLTLLIHSAFEKEQPVPLNAPIPGRVGPGPLVFEKCISRKLRTCPIARTNARPHDDNLATASLHERTVVLITDENLRSWHGTAEGNVLVFAEQLFGYPN